MENLTNQRKKMLLEMKKEIEQLEEDIKTCEIRNKKTRVLVNRKILLKRLHFTIPYIITVGIVMGIFSTIGLTPFILDKKKEYLRKQTKIDSSGNIKYEEQYNAYDNSFTTLLTKYSAWKENDNGLYSRQVNYMSIKPLTMEEATLLLESKNLEEMVEEFSTIKIETANDISMEKNKDCYFEITFYDIDKNDYIIITEPEDDNALSTLICIFCSISLNFATKVLVDEKKGSLNEIIKKTKEKYPIKNREVLERKLDIKKSNYNRLVD